jgi:hypothetical protein
MYGGDKTECGYLFYSCVKSLITQKCEDMPLIHLLTLKS